MNLVCSSSTKSSGSALWNQRARQDLHDAGDLLREVDTTIAALSSGCQVPGWKAKMCCRFCGIGIYKKSESWPIVGNLHTANAHNYFVCGHCGHVELFTLAGRQASRLRGMRTTRH